MASATGRGRGRPKDAMPASQRRDQLVGAAIDLIRRDGASVSMDDIAAEAGVTKPVLYAHFGGKDGLAVAIAELIGEALVYEIGAKLDLGDDAPPPRDQLVAATDVFIGWVQAEPAMFQFLVRIGASSDGRPHVLIVADRIAEAVRPVLEALYVALDRDPADAAVHAHGIVGFAYIAVEYWSRTAGAETSYEELLRSLTSFMWAGIADPEAMDSPSG